ncbi:hypothetical protein QTG56_25460 (plasmid) [Rossellomorea sp. AcN35-11]|nr:hypothetical protein [Rossellomorea aquimaris]WJV31964.1 hypothetical protein QTG56_25460 [Rossellomorea sp. AcN35-11]
MKKYKFKGSTLDDSFILNGIDIFKEKWIDTGKEAKVTDPIYGQGFTFTVWKVIRDDKHIVFAAGEFSNNVWGVYVP